jgi:hypothetical protein
MVGMAPAKQTAAGMRVAVPLALAIMTATLAACGTPRSPRLADPPPPAEPVRIDRLLTIVRAPSELAHDHAAVLPVAVVKRRLPVPFDVAHLARAYIDAETSTRAPHIDVQHLDPVEADARRVLESGCIRSRPRPLSDDCNALFREIADRYDAQAVVVVEDWAGLGELGLLSRTRAGLGLVSYRTQTTALKVVAYSHLGVQVVVLGRLQTSLGPPCHEDGSGVYELDPGIEPAALDPSRLEWLQRDLERRLHRSLDRALARSGIIDLNPAACADPANENKLFEAPADLFGG